MFFFFAFPLRMQLARWVWTCENSWCIWCRIHIHLCDPNFFSFNFKKARDLHLKVIPKKRTSAFSVIRRSRARYTRARLGEACCSCVRPACTSTRVSHAWGCVLLIFRGWQCRHRCSPRLDWSVDWPMILPGRLFTRQYRGHCLRSDKHPGLLRPRCD